MRRGGCRRDGVPYGEATLWTAMSDAVSWETLVEFLKLGIPGGLMMAAEGNSYDITTTLAGILGVSCPLRAFYRKPRC